MQLFKVKTEGLLFGQLLEASGYFYSIICSHCIEDMFNLGNVEVPFWAKLFEENLTTKQSFTCPTSVTSKKSPNVYKKWPNNDFTRKMKDFDTLTKNCLKICPIWTKYLLPQALKRSKVAQSAINRPIWSHCFLPENKIKLPPN